MESFVTVKFDARLKNIGRYQEWLTRFNASKDKLKFIATGSEGGATGFFAKVLSNSGYNCSHEHLFFFREPYKAPYSGASSWHLAPYFGDPFLARFTRVHLVRFPIRVMQTQFLIANGASGVNKIHLEGLMRRYERWHLGIHSTKPNIVFQVEKGEEALLKRLALPPRNSGIGNNYNSKLNKSFNTINFELFKSHGLDAEIKIICNMFGYDVQGKIIGDPNLDQVTFNYFNTNKECIMVPGITQELLPSYVGIENKIIELNKSDTKSIWHWSIEYSLNSEGKPPYITLWKSSKATPTVSEREVSCKIGMILDIIKQESIKNTTAPEQPAQ